MRVSSGNIGTTALIAASVTTNQTTGDLTNNENPALHVILDVTALSGTTPSVTATISGKDPASGKYYPLLVGAAVSAVSTNVYRVGRGLTAAANSVANDLVPRVVKVDVAIAGTTPQASYTVGVNYGL